MTSNGSWGMPRTAMAGFALLAALAVNAPAAANATDATGGGEGDGTGDAEQFAACIGDLGVRARASGISAAVVDDVLGNVRFVPRVIELDRRQPEFTLTFADYFNRRVTDARVARGRALLDEHRALLNRVQRQTGVPAQYLISLWGLETNFGSFFGNMSVPDSLATLACDPRRAGYFTGELLAALRIIDAGDIAAEQMQGSWAGAMGHVQFMPSVFLRYAVDGDGSGRRDLWNSVPDAMASAGNFLNGLGWTASQRWGREVLLPEGFPYELAGRNRQQPLSRWADLGVRDAFGNALPRADFDAALLIPDGHRGPAFLIYDNFSVLMRWNRSEFFALTVGHLADRIAGGMPLQRPPLTDVPALSRAQVQRLQERLNALGFDAGEADGVFGPATRQALSRFQRAEQRIADGFPDGDVLDALGVPRD